MHGNRTVSTLLVDNMFWKYTFQCPAQIAKNRQCDDILISFA